MRATAIDEIEERLHDLTDALHEAGADDLARPLVAHGADFTEPAQVRRAVNAICMQLERWRLDPSEVPDAPRVMYAANRLEDVCREALAGGVIEPASPSTGSKIRRKVAIALITVLAAAVALMVPIALIAAGVDFSDLTRERKLPLLRLPRGEETTLDVPILEAALQTGSVTAVEIGPLQGCTQALPSGATCDRVDSRLWPVGRLPTYELKLAGQAYGLLFAIDHLTLLGDSLGGGRLWLAATDDTPEGRYELPLEGTYHGYTPQSCDLLQKVLSSCPPPRTGSGEAHHGLPVPLVQLDVVAGDPARRTGEKRLAEAIAAEKQRQAAERVQQIEGVLGDLEGVLKETEKLVARKRFEDARGRIDKLVTLFAPLDALAQGAADAVPEALTLARERLDTLRDRQRAFEDQVFDKAFATLTAEGNRSEDEDKLLQRVANGFRVSAAYVQEIYTGRADEIKQRLDQRAQAHLDAVKAEQQAREQRCGPLPKDAWEQVQRYVKARYDQPRIRSVLGECLTPRLTERDCWELRCQFLTKEEVAVERPEVVTRHEASFFVVRGAVARQQGG